MWLVVFGCVGYLMFWVLCMVVGLIVNSVVVCLFWIY